MAELKLGTTIGGYRQLHEGISNPNFQNKLTLNSGLYVKNGIEFKDSSGYLLYTQTNWGIYWDTSTNEFKFRGAGSDRFKIDLDNGNQTFTGTVTQPTFSGSLSGNASTQSKLQTQRTISLSGDATGSQSFDGSSNITISVNVVDSDKVDGYHASQFLRSDTSDTMSGQLTLTAATNYQLNINNGYDQKILLQGSSNPYIRFREGSTDKQYIQWNSGGYLYLRNQEDGSGLRIKDSLDFTKDGSTFYTVWHSGNDGSGSGLDADTVDGLHASSFASSNADSEQTLGSRIHNFNYGAKKINVDPRWGVDGTGTDTGNLHIWTTKADGSNYGQAGIALYNGANGKYHYFYTVPGYWTKLQNPNGYIEFGPANTSYAHIYTDRPAFYFNKELYVNDGKVWHANNDGSGSGLDADKLDGLHSSSFLRSDTSDTMSGNLTIQGTVDVTSSSAPLIVKESDGNTMHLGGNEIDSLNDDLHLQNNSSHNVRVHGNVYANKVYGAVYNDYQEYRLGKEKIEPGYIAITDKDGRVKKCNKDRQKNIAGVVSDVFGFQIGEIENEINVPIQVSGRVLVYQKNRSKLKPGDQVCATKDGRVRKMKWWEKLLFPEAIVGFVDEIPSYDEWGSDKIKVNGRIWIRVR